MSLSMFESLAHMPREQKALKRFWFERYHRQAEVPVRMSPSGQPEGGFGMWDASVHAGRLMNRAVTDPDLARQLHETRDVPQSSLHPVTAAYRERRQTLQDERKISCGADRERLDLLMMAERKAYDHWAAQEHFRFGSNDVTTRSLDKTEREKDAAFLALYSYDRKHSHPLTDPNRNMEKDPPDLAERRAWMVQRENLEKGPARRLDHSNEKEMQGLGLVPAGWLDAEHAKEAQRKAPRHSGMFAPHRIERDIDRRRNIDKLMGRERPAPVAPLQKAMEAAVAPRASNRPAKLELTPREALVQHSLRQNNQASELVASARVGTTAVALPRDNRALAQAVRQRREQTKAQAPETVAKPSLGQTTHAVRMARQTPERQHAVRVAERMSQRHEKTGKTEQAHLLNPVQVERERALRQRLPRPTKPAREAAQQKLPAPNSPGFLNAVRQRASAFSQAMGEKWEQSFGRAKAHIKHLDNRLNRAINKVDRKFEKSMARLEERMPWGGPARLARQQKERAAATTQRQATKPHARPPRANPTPSPVLAQASTAARAPSTLKPPTVARPDRTPGPSKPAVARTGPRPNPNPSLGAVAPGRSRVMEIQVPSRAEVARPQAKAPMVKPVPTMPQQVNAQGRGSVGSQAPTPVQGPRPNPTAKGQKLPRPVPRTPTLDRSMSFSR